MKSFIFTVTALSIALSAPAFAKKPDSDEHYYRHGKSAEVKAKHKKSKKDSAERHHLKKEKKHKQKKHHGKQEREHKKSDKYNHDRDDAVSERQEDFDRSNDQKRSEVTEKTRPQVESTKESVMKGADVGGVNQDITVRQNDLNPVDIIIDTNVNSLKAKVDKYHGQAVDAIDQETLKLKQSTETSSPWWDLFGDK